MNLFRFFCSPFFSFFFIYISCLSNFGNVNVPIIIFSLKSFFQWDLYLKLILFSSGLNDDMDAKSSIITIVHIKTHTQRDGCRRERKRRPANENERTRGSLWFARRLTGVGINATVCIQHNGVEYFFQMKLRTPLAVSAAL